MVHNSLRPSNTYMLKKNIIIGSEKYNIVDWTIGNKLRWNFSRNLHSFQEKHLKCRQETGSHFVWASMSKKYVSTPAYLR